MADDETTSTAAPPPDGTDHERIGRVESKLDHLAEMVAKIVPGSHAEAEERTEARLDRGSNVEEMVKAELARAEKAKADQAAAEAEQSEQQSIRDQLAKLQEKPPAPPRMRRTVLLGWGDGRQ